MVTGEAEPDEGGEEVLTRTVQIPVVQPGGQIIREPLVVAVKETDDAVLSGTHPDVVRLLELNVQVFIAHRPPE